MAQLTLKQAGERIGLHKKTIRNYMRDKADPLPYTVAEDGVIYVEEARLSEWLERHPQCGKPRDSEPDHAPEHNDETAKQYYTLSEAAAASGYKPNSIRMMTRRPEDPLPFTRNKDGWILIEQTTFWAYLKRRSNREPVAVEQPARQAYVNIYPEIENLPGMYHTPAEYASVLNLPVSVLRSWVKDPFRPLDHIRRGNRVYISKHVLFDYLQHQESKPGLFKSHAQNSRVSA